MAKAKGSNANLIQSSSAAFNEFKKIFESLSYTQNYADTFEDFLDFSLYMLSYHKSPEQIEVMNRMEAKYKKKEQAEQMAQLFLLFGQAAENYNSQDDGLEFSTNGVGFHDVLGDLFMELVSHGHNGQYFTPQHVCDMMSLMIIGDPKDKGTDPFSGDAKTICDPACGSGRMLMSAAKIDRNAIFYGADVSGTCVKMTALNMVVNTMVGEVACMNSLSLEHHWSFHIRRVKIDGVWMPVLFRTGKNESRMVPGAKDPADILDYTITAEGNMEPISQKVDAKGIVDMIRHLFAQIPQKDVTQYMHMAEQSGDMVEKRDLWHELHSMPTAISNPAPLPRPVPPPPPPPMPPKPKPTPPTVVAGPVKSGTLF